MTVQREDLKKEYFISLVPPYVVMWQESYAN